MNYLFQSGKKGVMDISQITRVENYQSDSEKLERVNQHGLQGFSLKYQ